MAPAGMDVVWALVEAAPLGDGLELSEPLTPAFVPPVNCGEALSDDGVTIGGMTDTTGARVVTGGGWRTGEDEVVVVVIGGARVEVVVVSVSVSIGREVVVVIAGGNGGGDVVVVTGGLLVMIWVMVTGPVREKALSSG
jgi:hypothetical protein